MLSDRKPSLILPVAVAVILALGMTAYAWQYYARVDREYFDSYPTKANFRDGGQDEYGDDTYSEWLEWFFAPMHWLDRKLRPRYWGDA